MIITHGGQVHTNTIHQSKGGGMKKLLTLCMFALITGFVMAPLSHAGDSKLIEGNVLKIEAYGRDNGQARYLISPHTIAAEIVAAGGSAGKTERSERC
jgi:hypothetical protein